MTQSQKIKLLANQVRQNILQVKGARILIISINVLLFFALITGFINQVKQQESVHHFGEEVRDQWENSPDKHPHRMAHYGYLVFREKFPLAYFDFGMDSYLGNVVFLEAHKQNTVNFSEANLSNGLLRFGEISGGMVLQILVPLLIFFWGFDLVSRDREHGTLKILFAQGVEGKALVWGRSLGLFRLVLALIALPFLLGLMLLFFQDLEGTGWMAVLHYGIMSLGYLIYFLILCLIAVWVSAVSKSSKSSLTTLIGCWLFFILVLPKVSQVVGQSLFPSPSKIEFDTAVEAELILLGDSHNPNDPHYAALKDSLLNAYEVDSTHQLPFNYGGFVMREGERLSTETYLRHQERLVHLYIKQQDVVKQASWINPYLSIKFLSMSLVGTDYRSYLHFQNQAESYRYKLAQTMNELQIELIGKRVSDTSGPVSQISQSHWVDFPDFHPSFLPSSQVLSFAASSLLSLIFWLIFMTGVISVFSRKIKAS